MFCISVGEHKSVIGVIFIVTYIHVAKKKGWVNIKIIIIECGINIRGINHKKHGDIQLVVEKAKEIHPKKVKLSQLPHQVHK